MKLRVVYVALLMLVAVAGAAIAGPLGDAEAANDRGDYATALRLFRSLAEQGDADAQYRLGHMYFVGQGIPQDYAETLKWYRRAADQGLSLAQFALGLIYYMGQAVPEDKVLAHKWFNLSAAQGQTQAAFLQNNLASRMTPAEIADAQRLAREWKPTSSPPSR
jgi:TPR repeat protein